MRRSLRRLGSTRAVIVTLTLLAGAACGGEATTGGQDALGGDVGDGLTVTDTGAADTTSTSCGEPRATIGRTSGAIVNGSASWDPDLVALDDARGLAVGAVIRRHQGGDEEITCTGTLVAPKVVLTAAHCVMRSPTSTYAPSSLRFAVGPDVASPRATFDVSAVHAHPSYDYWGSDASHDVSVMILSGSATDALGAAIRPLPVNCDGFPAGGFVGETLQTVGYGATDKWGQEFGTEQRWAPEEIVGLSTIDFTVDGNDQAGVCYGDSGGPGLFELGGGPPVIVGVLSWGDELCTREDHFVRTDHECDFITSYLPACGAVTASGGCDGDTAVYCASDAVVRDDCASRGEVCAVDGAGAARCRAKAVDPCAGETFAGRCDGATAVWCEGQQVKRRECAPCELGCGWVAALGGYDCVTP